MSRAIITTLALAGLAHGLGSANVVNQCNYDVYLTNVPASTSGEAIVGPLTIAPGSDYSQTYTQLASAGGWSLKLSTDSSLSQVLQYEYSYPGSDILYFDASQINGDPFGGNWAFSSNGGCNPGQAAYTYPTDDEAAMQSCPASSSVTLTLCPSSGNTNGARDAPPAPTTFVTAVRAAATAAPPAPPASI